jgi:hypothetical protein
VASPSSTVAATNVIPQAPRSDSPWASYRLAQGPDGGLRAVRVRN